MTEAVVRIEKMVFGGAGFGHIGGKACFIPLTAPGDVARILIKKEKRSYLEGELLELLEPSERRTAPLCPLFGVCGGCNWQHLPYSEQLLAKEEIFAGFLCRSGQVSGERILPIVPSPDPFAYRSRIQLKVHAAFGTPQIGFYRSGSHYVVDISQGCAIAHPVINRLIGGLRAVLASFPDKGRVPQVDLAISDEGEIEVVVHYIGGRLEEAAGHFRRNSPTLGAAGVFLQTGRKCTLQRIAGDHPSHLSYKVPSPPMTALPDMRLSFSSGGFSQVNFRQNLALIDTVYTWAGLTGSEKVLDIYCGNGNFALPLAASAAQVVGVEEYGPSLAAARENCASNGIGNASFIHGDAREIISQMACAHERFDLVLLDPPREGAAEVARSLADLKARAIIYVSCDPATLARDIGIFHKSGYEVVKSRPVDMFPQTHHIESVTLLVPSAA